MPSVSRNQSRLILLAVVAVAAVVIGLVTYSGKGLDSLELSSVDTRFSVRSVQPAPTNIVIVGIDDATLTDTRMPQWPFARRYHARVIDTLRHAGARAIGYDVEFIHRSSSPTDDQALIEAAARARGIVLATTKPDLNGHTNIFGGDSVLRQIGARAGNASLLPDSDGVFRRVPYVVQKLTTFPVVLAEQATHRLVSPSEFPGGAAPVDFVGPPGRITEIPFVSVYRKQFPPGYFRGKIVIVGAMSSDLHDVHTTAVGLMSGAEYQASALDTVLRGNPLRDAPGALNVILIVLFGLVAPAACLVLRPAGVVAVAVALGLVFALVAQLAFDGGTILAFVYPLLALVVGTVGSNTVQLVLERRQRETAETRLAQLPSDMAADFFICYRRDESSWPARILRDELVKRFGESSVFMDLDSIDAGQEWPARIEDEIRGCGVILVLIGRNWLEAKGQGGARRIDDADDWVRLEIEAGLREKDAVVVPVLLDGAPMPDEQQLPESLRPLAHRNAIALDANHWSTEIDELVDSIRKGRIRDFLRQARASPDTESSTT